MYNEMIETNAKSGEPSCFESFLENCLPPRFRKDLPMIALLLLTLWGLTSDTALSMADVATDYTVGIDYLR